MKVIIFWGTLFFSSVASNALAVCSIQSPELELFNANLLIPQSTKISTLIIANQTDETSETLSLSIERPGFPSKTLNNIRVRFKHTEKTVTTSNAGSTVFTAVIVPPSVSDSTVRLDLPKKLLPDTRPLPWIESDSYVKSSLGKQGAIILVNKNDLSVCKENPQIIYVVPNQSGTIDPDLSGHNITVEKEDFQKILLDVFMAGGDYLVQSESLDTLFDVDRNGTTFFTRRLMLSGPVEVSLPRTMLNKITDGTSIGNSKSFLSFPLYSEWKHAIDRLALFPELLRLRDASATELPYYLNKRAAIDDRIAQGKAEPDELKDALAMTEKFLVDMTPVSALANSAYNSEKSFMIASMGKTPLNQRNFSRLMDEGTELALIEREIGNFDLFLISARSDYEKLYALVHKTPLITFDNGLDFTTIRNSSLESVSESCKLPVQEYKTKKISTKVQNKTLSLSGKLFVIYRNFKDPIEGLNLVRPHFLWAADASALHQLHKDIVSESIPSSSCRNRYGTENSFITKSNNNAIEGSSNVKYEKWICEDHVWVCFKGWIPQTCTNTIKTRVYSVDTPLSFYLLASLGSSDNIRFSLSSNFQNSQSDVGFSLGDSGTLDTLKSTAGLQWESSFFTHAKSDESQLLLVLKGQGKPVRWSTACSLHKTIDELMTSK